MKIALLGYGKMGKAVEKDAVANGHEIVLKFNSQSGPASPTDLQKADVAIEFSTPATVLDNIYVCLDAGVPLVVGTTGWYDKLSLITEDVNCRTAALFYASNFSIGVNIFFQLNEMLADIMNDFPEYEVDVEEVHHTAKLDSPSGTAITLADGLSRYFSRKKGWENVLSGRPAVQFTEPAPQSRLKIYSAREGDITGIHSVNYFSENDQIQISHRAFNRKGFAQGAVLAAEWLVGKQGIYTMRDLLAMSHEPGSADTEKEG